MTKEELEEFNKTNMDYVIQVRDDEYNRWIDDEFADINDVINNPTHYRIIVIIHEF